MTWLLAACIGLCAVVIAQSAPPIPKYERRVTDLTGTLTEGEQAALEEKVAAFAARKGYPLAILIVHGTSPKTIEDYSLEVFRTWKLGEKYVGGKYYFNAVILVVAKDERRAWIAVRGVWRALTYSYADRRIIEETITPLWRRGYFFDAINSGVDRIIRVLDGEVLTEPDPGWSENRLTGEWGEIWEYLPVLLVAALLAGASILHQWLGRRLAVVIEASVIGALLWMLGDYIWSVLAAFLLYRFAVSPIGSEKRGDQHLPDTSQR